MKYVFTEGPYREFRGYVFANGNPVTITDRGTLEAIQKDHSFRRYDEEIQRQEAPEEVLTERPVLHVAKRGWPAGRPRK